MKKIAQLPDITVTQLQRSRAEDQDEFLALVLALREHKWPLRTIADATGVSRVAVSKWQAKAQANEEITKNSKTIFVPRIPLFTHGVKTKAKRIVPTLSAEQTSELQTLAEQAKTVQRWTRKDAPEKLAADRYESLLIHYVNNKGISVTQLAKTAGVTRRAIAQRLEKHTVNPERRVE